MDNRLILGDCLEKMKEFPDNSIDAIVTDPPYELGFMLGFMGKKWDNTGIAYNTNLWKEALRVLKPGGHLLAFGGTRTYHRMAVAIEDAGFEVRDMIEWIYASGFSKGNTWNKGKKRTSERLNKENDLMVANGYEGWGNSGIKPAHEPIAFCRKPIEKGLTVAQNMLKWGCGAISIDGCRIPTTQADASQIRTMNRSQKTEDNGWGMNQNGSDSPQVVSEQGRFPANIIVTDDALNDGVMTKGTQRIGKRSGKQIGTYGEYVGQNEVIMGHSDSGSKSRYFDIDVWAEKHGLLQFPKASKRMKVLIACEESQAVCKAFRKLGHEAYSCDILPCSGGHPEWHIQGDVLEQLDKGWDLMIAHPPCTDLAVSGAAWFEEKIKDGRQQRAVDFVQKLLDAPIPKIALENPVGVISTKIRKPDQIIQPYQFGDSFSKKTCLWLKGLTNLIHTKLVDKGEFVTYASGKRMSKWYAEKWGKGGERSKTFQGIADAMAEQWGGQVETFNQDVWAEKHGLLQFPKASKKERNEGLDCYLTVKYNGDTNNPLCREENTVAFRLLQKVISEQELANFSIDESGVNIMGQCHRDSLSIILTETKRIIGLKIYNSLMHSLTNESTQDVNSETESGGNLAESVEDLKRWILTTTKGSQELALGASRAVLKMLQLISEEENWKPAINVHSTVKPVHLMSWLVRLVSREGDTVLDPFMGSGTTGVACAKLGRSFIGIELDEEYIKIAECRIEKQIGML